MSLRSVNHSINLQSPNRQSSNQSLNHQSLNLQWSGRASGFRRHGRDQGLDVADREREALVLVLVALDVRHVIGHQRAVVAQAGVDGHRVLDIAFISFIREELKFDNIDVLVATMDEDSARARAALAAAPEAFPRLGAVDFT